MSCPLLEMRTLEEEQQIESDNIQSSDDNNNNYHSNSGSIDRQSHQSDIINSLPLQILTDDILYGLPFESLVKCLCVCRRWNSLVCDPSFTSRHRNRPSTRLSFISKRIDSNNIKFYKYEDEITGLVDCSYKITGLKYTKSSSVHLSNFVEGLTCVYDLGGGVPYLFNPFTRQLAVLPRSNTSTSSLGFGFDVSTGKYKLIRLTTLASGGDRTKYCEVLTIGTREWRYVGRIPGPDSLGEPVFVHGAIHWLGYGWKNTRVYCFQIGEEKFVAMKTPEISNRRREVCNYEDPQDFRMPLQTNLCDLGGCLSITLYCRSNQPRLTIWTMKVYDTQEWMILCNIDMSSILYSRAIYWDLVLGLENDKIVLTTSDRDREQMIFSYDIREKRFYMVGAKQGVDFSMFLVRSDSLLSPRKLIGNDNDL